MNGMTTEACTIGVDLGGQSIKLAGVDGSGRIRVRRQTPIDASRPVEELAALMLSEIEAIQAEARAAGLTPTTIGMVMPGYMDRERTRLTKAANLPTLSGTDFLGMIRRGVKLPVTFDADSNAAAVAEYRFGAGRGVERLIVVVVGTGIGGSVVLEGQIPRIFNHLAGSLGHVIVDARGPRCACGAQGCVEARASGRALERLAAELADAEPTSRLAALRKERGRLTGVEIGQALAEGDAAAAKVVRECGWWLGAGIAAWTPIYAPQKVLVGGGIIGLGEPYLEAVRAGLHEVGMPHLTADIVVDAAALGPDAGVIGAAAIGMAAAESGKV
ncbi:MAG TPA: ROK family protein [Phycisphaerae bacterium]|jgi:glucokinase|nr:ROK family protein [Phycisphaerae bacterium]HOB76631.1 ROK family protein [Phycisphaerae bacterium]HOJ53690.1 ROK family protein [Phycisphaerae bacterium]HOL27991.1 ROK family protein [Phycisphaerae bacterium]HPP22361.1 ROK family protein [Phycisphaerae bacterium]